MATPEDAPTQLQQEAATKIQAVFKGHQTRLRMSLTRDHIASEGHSPPASSHTVDNPHNRGYRGCGG